MERTNLKVLRIKNKMTQDEMARKLGYTRSTYSAIESGKRNGRKSFWNDLQKAFSIADADMWYLMQKDEEKR